ncbi:MAG TPA: conjugative transposon protein TraM [Flavobacterium sp.]|uniref:conjugative transposon protein TraM n=1 Tax=Flavobacterium sp. TaxID=239 RepID=UPI002DB67D21|nr:conjugative transposon protein TraM [Flavobacterium sp.]HEU4790339.1 conjugative transposon protein TraM [Flavobacterium sp.]
MLLILPVLTLPFITLLFWTLGGGRMNAITVEPEGRRGFNVELPEPKFKVDSDLDKMSYYDQAALDSIKRKEQIRKDPNYVEETFFDDSESIGYDTLPAQKSYRQKRSALNTSSFKNPNEEKVYQKLEALQKAISQPSDAIGNGQDMSEFENQRSSTVDSDDVKSLEQMMSAMNQPQAPDPELKQLGGMLENILDIQHPGRVAEKLKQSSINQKGKVFAVDKKGGEDNITSLQVATQKDRNDQGALLRQDSFYSLEEGFVPDEMQNALEAVIPEMQVIVDGSTVKLRLSSDVFIEGVSIPKNSFLFGIASLKGERLVVKISNIKYKNSLFPVELSVYDMDGIAGIYIPGAINRDVAKASADRSIQTLGVASLDDSWGAQAAGVGIEAAKSLLSKKVKLIKVVVKAGYQVLLYDEKQKNSK